VLLAVMGLLVGAPSAPAKVTGPNLTFNPATFNFGTSPKAFALTNSGDTATGAIVVSRSGASNYTLGPDGCTGKSLGPGKSCSVTVSFYAARSLRDRHGDADGDGAETQRIRRAHWRCCVSGHHHQLQRQRLVLRGSTCSPPRGQRERRHAALRLYLQGG